MRLVVFGATGPTGKQLVKQALEDGHEVTAVARRPEAVTEQGERLRVLRGDVLDPATLAPALPGADAVLSALGVGADLRPTTVISRGTAHIIAAMREAGVRRLVVLTSAGGLHDPREPLLVRVVVRPLLKNIFADHQRTEEGVRASGLDWTLVRPPRLTNGKRTGVYQLARETYVPGGHSISRADVAEFMIKEAAERAYLGCAVAIGYGLAAGKAA